MNFMYPFLPDVIGHVNPTPIALVLIVFQVNVAPSLMALLISAVIEVLPPKLSVVVTLNVTVALAGPFASGDTFCDVPSPL